MSAFYAFTMRACRETMQDWLHSVFRLVFQPAVYLLVFGKVLGPAFPGADYTSVVAPGILAMLVMNAALGNIGSVISRGYYFRSMEGWLLAPVGMTTLMLAWTAGSMLAAALAGLIGGLLVYLLLGLAPQSPSLALFCLLYGAAAFSLLGVIGYTLAETPAKAQNILSFILLPMMYLGCTFFSYAMLPAPWNLVALLLPTTYLSEALRMAYGSVAAGLDTAIIAAGGVGALLSLFVLADWAFRRRLRNFLW